MMESDVEANNGLFRFDLQSVQAENIPLYVQPDDAGAGRWIQVTKGISKHDSLSEISGGVPTERYHIPQDTYQATLSSIQSFWMC